MLYSKWMCVPLFGLAASLAVAAAPEPQEPVATVEGLSGPESVHYDAERDVYYVGNFNGDAAGDANGFVSRVGPHGAILEREFLTGTSAHPLHGPRGMRLAGDRLWVVDADGLHAFDPESGGHLQFVDFREFEPGFLNDVALEPGGALIVTDTGGDGRVFRVDDGVVSLVLDAALESPPNGVARLADGSFVFAPWGGGRLLQSWRAGSESPGNLGTMPEGGNMDGIEPWRDGLLIASQADQSIWFWHGEGARRIVRTPGRPADIGLDTRRNRVAVPYIALDRVDIWPLPE